MATKPYRKNAWSFRSSVLPDPASISFNPRRSLLPHQLANNSHGRSPPKSRRHIFQRLQDTREQHALDRHAKACWDYLQSKENVKNQCQKKDEELLMENCHLYRTHVENAELLELARSVEDIHSGEQVWEMSLREHWTVEPRIGDLYSTPICYLKEGIQKGIEQIGFPGKANLNDNSASQKNVRQCTLTSYKHFIQTCGKKLGKANLHKPNFDSFEVIGRKLTMTDAVETKEKHEESNTEQVQEQQPVSGVCQLSGPRVELSDAALFLTGITGDFARSNVVTLRNTGSTFLYYRWEQQPAIALTEALRKCRGQHCFYIFPEFGSILPGETKEFIISFRSHLPGTFIATWLLRSAPKLLTPLEPLIVRGVAVSEDTNRMQRELLKEELEKRQRRRAIDEVLTDLVDDSIKGARSVFKEKPSFILSPESFRFIRSNQLFEPPLYYTPTTYLQFEKLALTEMPALTDEITTERSMDAEKLSNGSTDTTSQKLLWDGSVSNLLERISNVNDEQQRERLNHIVADLVKFSTLPPHPSSLLHTAMYKTLATTIDQMEEVMQEMKKQQLEAIEGSDADPNLNEPTMDIHDNNKQAMAAIAASAREANLQEPTMAINANGQSLEGGVSLEEETSMDSVQIVRIVLQEGMEHFLSEVKDAVGKLASVLKCQIEGFMEEGDLESACWIALWLERFKEIIFE